MSIDKRGLTFVPVCDCCGAELPGKSSFADAVAVHVASEWRSDQDDRDGNWYDLCPDCQREADGL